MLVFQVFFGAVVALTLSTPAPHPRVTVRAVATQGTPRPTADELYSLRARRRMAAYLRLRLLEWRKEGLSRAVDVIERRLPVDSLVPKP